MSVNGRSFFSCFKRLGFVWKKSYLCVRHLSLVSRSNNVKEEERKKRKRKIYEDIEKKGSPPPLDCCLKGRKDGRLTSSSSIQTNGRKETHAKRHHQNNAEAMLFHACTREQVSEYAGGCLLFLFFIFYFLPFSSISHLLV